MEKKIEDCFNSKVNAGKIDFNDPEVRRILDNVKEAQRKLKEQIRRNNSMEGMDKIITI